MKILASVRGIAAAFLALAIFAVPARAEAPTLMGSFKSWYVYSVGADTARVCYALGQPTSTLPKGVRRGPIYVIISTWPARGVRNEPSVVPGYPYKHGVPAEIACRQRHLHLFTKNQGTDGGAWIQAPAEEARLIEAMKHGISA